MKIKKIGSLCKSTGKCTLFDEVTEDGELQRQWISDGRALWPVTGLPLLRASNLSTLFDFSDKQTENIIISEKTMPESFYSILYDAENWEEPLLESFISIQTHGAELMALTAEETVIWLDAAELQPCWTKETRLVLRKRNGEDPVVAVLDGMFLNGIILPAVPIPAVYQELRRLGMSQPKLGLSQPEPTTGTVEPEGL